MRTSAHPTDSRTGFSLVEVLTALVLIAVISTLLSQVLQGILRSHELQQSEHEALRQREQALGLQFSGELEKPLITLEELKKQ